MSDIFHQKIQKALADPNLQAALDGNAERRISAREQAYASLPEDLQTMRQRAHAVRAETIANLDHYLEQFIARAQANGLIVHRAADAAQAVQVVLEIARQKDAHLVAKSKTMVGEEIEVNRALEAAGLKVVETDLGEYIVQLRGERPAHIITPAVHLRRAQVGQTFHEKLGLPLTEDIPTLTSAARRILRQTFLEADIGISGVNFGVAESGTLCIVTNEGNGRMVTTLPRVHIALMGMERLVPTLDDLALMLALLPRSATGQKLSVYTSLIHAPRREDEVDGPDERHLVLVDNGRSAMRRSPLAEALYCIRCGACLNACPVFREIGGHAYVSVHGEGSPYPGPIGSIVSPALFGQQEFGQLARASSLCGACKEACPVDIDLPKLLLRVRAGGEDLKSTRDPSGVPPAMSWGLRLYNWAARSPWRFASAQRATAFFSRLLAPASGWLHMPAFTGWGYSRDLPRPAARSFRQRWAAGQVEHRSGFEAPQPSAQADEREVQESKTRAMTQAELLERFEHELNELGGTVTRCRATDLAASVLALLQARRVKALLAWDEDHLPSGILGALQEAGIEVLHRPDPGVKAGLTGALAGIAETGTLVLPSGQGRMLSASLLPEVHIAVLRISDLRPSLEQVFKEANAGPLQQVRQASTLALISGPSRTADIEMTLTIGVHGPGEVHVFCLED
jgi:L-lactate dehydrogenase complex protein LldF